MFAFSKNEAKDNYNIYYNDKEVILSFPKWQEELYKNILNEIDGFEIINEAYSKQKKKLVSFMSVVVINKKNISLFWSKKKELQEDYFFKYSKALINSNRKKELIYILKYNTSYKKNNLINEYCSENEIEYKYSEITFDEVYESFRNSFNMFSIQNNGVRKTSSNHTQETRNKYKTYIPIYLYENHSIKDISRYIKYKLIFKNYASVIDLMKDVTNDFSSSEDKNFKNNDYIKFLQSLSKIDENIVIDSKLIKISFDSDTNQRKSLSKTIFKLFTSKSINFYTFIMYINIIGEESLPRIAKATYLRMKNFCRMVNNGNGFDKDSSKYEIIKATINELNNRIA